MATLAVTGTITESTTESNINTDGGKVFVLTLTGDTWVPSTSLAAFSDDFNRANSDSLGSNWTEVSGDADIASNAYRLSTGSWGSIVSIYTGTACSTVNQYVKITFVNNPLEYPGVFLRYTDASSPVYFLQFGTDDQVTWSSRPTPAGSDTTIGGPTALNITTGTVVGITITGTGTNTVVRIWKSPTGNAPNAADDWGGDTSPDITFTNDPGTAVDTGNYVGLGGAQGTADQDSLDDFYGGDIP